MCNESEHWKTLCDLKQFTAVTYEDEILIFTEKESKLTVKICQVHRGDLEYALPSFSASSFGKLSLISIRYPFFVLPDWSFQEKKKGFA